MFFSSFCLFVFFKQKTAYEMRISDWSSDVCSSDLPVRQGQARHGARRRAWPWLRQRGAEQGCGQRDRPDAGRLDLLARPQGDLQGRGHPCRAAHRSEEHTSELQSLMRISYAVFCLKKKKKIKQTKSLQLLEQ